MREGLVRAASYADEFSALNAQQFLADNGVNSQIFAGGIIMYVQQFDLYVAAGRLDEAKRLLEEFEAAERPAPDAPDTEGQDLIE